MDGLGEEKAFNPTNELEGGASFVGAEDSKCAADAEHNGAPTSERDRMFLLVAAKASKFSAYRIELKGALDDRENSAFVPMEKLIGWQQARPDMHEKKLKDLRGDVRAEAGLKNRESIDRENCNEGAGSLAGLFERPFDGKAGEQFEGVLDRLQLDGI